MKTIYNRYKGYTWYMQMMLNELFALTDEGQTCIEEMIPVAHMNVIYSQNEHYKELLANLATKQKALLKAISKECVLTNDWIGGLTLSLNRTFPASRRLYSRCRKTKASFVFLSLNRTFPASRRLYSRCRKTKASFVFLSLNRTFAHCFKQELLWKH